MVSQQARTLRLSRHPRSIRGTSVLALTNRTFDSEKLLFRRNKQKHETQSLSQGTSVCRHRIMVLHKTGTLDPSGCPGSIPGVGVSRSRIESASRFANEAEARRRPMTTSNWLAKSIPGVGI